jgi:Homeodomain-like domain
MNVRYIVELTSEERDQLKALTVGGVGQVRRIKRAQVLLAADSGISDEEIARAVGVGTSTVYRTEATVGRGGRRARADASSHAREGVGSCLPMMRRCWSRWHVPAPYRSGEVDAGAADRRADRG